MSSHSKEREEKPDRSEPHGLPARGAQAGGLDGGVAGAYKADLSRRSGEAAKAEESGKKKTEIRRPGATRPRPGGSVEARRLAAAILEVLGGERSPTEAAQALGTSLPRYYALESRALSGLVAGCEPRPMGRVRKPEREVEALRRENEKLKREVGRSQALVRMAQRAAGLPATSGGAARRGRPEGKGKRRRRPVARALKAARELGWGGGRNGDGTGTTAGGTGGGAEALGIGGSQAAAAGGAGDGGGKEERGGGQ